ncbi:hypothetical protein EV424DRAFT_1341083 [Suillus variegatus]|nr:hypothetical protein EV424DRAFT_1341083 [Suillus variegatus]
MSTPVQSSLAGLKASTAQLMGIIASTWHVPAGSVHVHIALTRQVTTLLADIIRVHEKGDYIPGIVASCSKELMRVLPNWHSIGYDDPRVARHAWHKQVCAWEALGDNSCDLPVVPNPSTGPLTVNLLSPPVPSPTPVSSPSPVISSPPVVASNVARPSSNTTSEFRDKGKGKAISVDLEPEVGGSSKRKSPIISGHSSQPLKSAMKGHKRVKSTRVPKSKPFVESEDDEDIIVQPILRGVPEVVLPQLSTIVVRTPQLPRSPGSPMKQSFGPALLTASSRPEVPKPPISRPEARATSGSRLEVEEFSDNTSSASNGDPPATTTFDITIPDPNNPCHYCIKEDWPCATHLDKRSSLPCLSCIRCSTKKIKCNPASLGSPPKRIQGKSTTGRTPVRSLSFAVPRAALDVPMPDLHSMAITIRDSAACIAILEARVQEQDAKIDTLQCLHESLWRTVVDRHPSFSLPDTLADATILLDQSGPPLMEPTPLTVEDGSAMVGLMVEPTQVQPKGPQSSGKIVLPDEPGNLLAESSSNIVVPNEPGNLLPEYDSSDEEMDVEGKVDLPGEEVAMATSLLSDRLPNPECWVPSPDTRNSGFDI